LIQGAKDEKVLAEFHTLPLALQNIVFKWLALFIY